jgi:hypothetical protein
MDKCESKNDRECNEYKHSSTNNDIQLLKKYVHDIRNSKIFNIDILKNINNLSYDDRIEILIAYNEMISYYSSLFE